MRFQLKMPFVFQLKHTLDYCTAVQLNEKRSVKPPKASLKLTMPKLDKEHIQLLKNVSGLHLGSTGISWALLNVENENRYNLLEWNHFPFPVNIQKLHVYDLCKLVLEVQQNLPESDIYVIEGLSAPNRSKANPVQQGFLELITQLQSMICVALSCQDPSLSVPKLVFLKNRLPGRIFNLLIKSECITSRHIIENIIGSQLLSDTDYYEQQSTLASDARTLDARDFLNFHTRIVMDEGRVAAYDASKGYAAESLALALLNGICFSDLIVRPRASVVKRLQLPGS